MDATQNYDVGVLVVHGIGTQAEGSSLRDFVDPVVHLLEGVSDGAVTLLPAPAKKMVGLHRAGDAKDSKDWLIAEAWWAEAFDTPDRKEVGRWLIDTSSWFVYFFVCRLWRRAQVGGLEIALGLVIGVALVMVVGRSAMGLGLREATWALGVSSVIGAALWAKTRNGRVPIVVMSIVVFFPLAALATVGSVALFVIGLLPGKWSARVRELQLGLSRSIGDSYALISSPRRERAMFDAIVEAAEALVERLDKGPTVKKPRPLVISAHSQGAALVYRLLSKRDPGMRRVIEGRDVTLMTHGSAVMPVHVLEQRRMQHRSLAGLQGFAGLAGLLLLAFTLGRVAASTVDPVTVRVAGVSAVLIAISFLAVRRDERAALCLALQAPDKPPAKQAVDKDKEKAQETDQQASRKDATQSAVSLAAPEMDVLREAKYDVVVGPPRTLSTAETKPLVDGGKSLSKEDNPKRPALERFCPGITVPVGTTLRWIDLWAPWDPVPNGPLDPAFPYVDDRYAALTFASRTEFIPCVTANVYQPWQDHVVYRFNPEDVVLRWITEVERRTGVSNSQAQGIDKETAPTIRRRRANVNAALLTSQVVLFFAAVYAVVRRWSEIDDFGRAVRQRFPGPVRTVVGTAVDLVPEQVRNWWFGESHDPARLQGLLGAAAAFLLGTAVVTVLMTVARRSFSDLLTKPANTSAAPAAVAMAVAAVAFTALLGVAERIGHDPQPGLDDRVITVRVSLLATRVGIDNVKVSLDPLDIEEDDTVHHKTGKDGKAEFHLDRTRPYSVKVESKRVTDCIRFPSNSRDVVEYFCDNKGPDLSPDETTPDS